MDKTTAQKQAIEWSDLTTQDCKNISELFLRDEWGHHAVYMYTRNKRDDPPKKLAAAINAYCEAAWDLTQTFEAVMARAEKDRQLGIKSASVEFIRGWATQEFEEAMASLEGEVVA